MIYCVGSQQSSLLSVFQNVSRHYGRYVKQTHSLLSKLRFVAKCAQLNVRNSMVGMGNSTYIYFHE